MQLAVMDSSTEMQEVRVAKSSSDKEQDAHESTGLAHSGKHLGQRDEHQAGACTHALGTGESHTRRGMIMAPASRATPVSKISI